MMFHVVSRLSNISNEELKSFVPDRLKPSVTKATTLLVAVMFIPWGGPVKVASVF